MVTLSRLIGLVAGFFGGIVLHEWAHAKVADALGDKLPRAQGRTALSPKRHADPIGTLAIPALFALISLVGQFGDTVKMVFGYGKPQQNNVRGYRNPKRDQIIVALAGPAVNLILAAAGGLLGSRLLSSGLGLIDPRSIKDVVGGALIYMMTVNVFILIVNVLPIPGLDGARVLGVFMNPSTQMKLQEWTQYLLLFMLVIFLFLQGVIAAMANPVCRAFAGNLLRGCPL